MRKVTATLLVAGMVLGCQRSDDAPSAQRDAGGPEYRVRPAEGGGVIVDVPAIGVSAWLPGEPTRHAGSSSKPFGHRPVVELAAGPPEMGCGLSWYSTDGAPDPESKLGAVLDEYVRLLVATQLASGDVPFGDGLAKEAIVSMTLRPNVGTAHVRHFVVKGHIVTMHTFVLGSDRVDPVIVRCLESVTARDAGGREIKAPPVAVRF